MTTDEIRAMLAAATPGPLVISFESVDPEWAIVSTYGGRVVANVHCDYFPSGFCDDANARLTAAAPTIAALAITQAEEIERLRELLQLWDNLIDHQYSGSREAMSDMTYIAQATAAVLKEPKP
jgi:hypothetical protein